MLTQKLFTRAQPHGRRQVATSAMLKGLFGGGGDGANRKLATTLAPKEATLPGHQLATFASGCFWGIELAYQRVPGVAETSVGYTGGSVQGPSYQEVCSGKTGHTEAVQVQYDPSEVTYDKLLDVFFDRTDPTTLNRQGNDAGTQYRSGIYYHTDEQKAAAMKRVALVNEMLARGEQVRPDRPYSGKKVVSEVLPAGDYWLAEDYHQQYLSKGGRMGRSQSAAKGCTDNIRCYG